MEHNNPLPKRNIFIVPEGYFEKMEHSIREKVHQKEKTNQTQFSWSRLAPVGIAAAIILIGLFKSPTEPSAGTPEELLADVSEEQLSLYLSVNESPGSESITTAAEHLDEFEEEYLFVNEKDSFINLN